MSFIGECGHEVWSKDAKQCRACWLTERRKEPKRCLDCNTVLERGGNGGVSRSTRCWECFVKHAQSVNPCANCGKSRKNANTLQKDGNRSPLCRACYDAARTLHSKTRQCSIEGCDQPPRGEGLCWNHLKLKRAQENTSNLQRTKKLKAYIRSLPCMLCGFDRWPGECARIHAGHPYEENNVMPLCRNCHYGVDKGYIELPSVFRIRFQY